MMTATGALEERRCATVQGAPDTFNSQGLCAKKHNVVVVTRGASQKGRAPFDARVVVIIILIWFYWTATKTSSLNTEGSFFEPGGLKMRVMCA